MKKQTPPAEETTAPEESAPPADDAVAEEKAADSEESATPEPAPPKKTSPLQTALAIVFFLGALAAAYWSFQKNFSPPPRPTESAGPPAGAPGM